MAEFQEVMRQRKRMCNSTSCYMCDIFRLCGEDVLKCPQFINNNPKRAEKIVMSWAAEHPEPKYPSWEEWLQSVGVMESSEGLLRRIKCQLYIDGIPAHAVPTAKVLQPIDAEIAEKLGIEPKEG